MAFARNRSAGQRVATLMISRHPGLVTLCLSLAALLPRGVGAAAPPVDFQRDIQPILADNCYHCHGPDSNRRKADLRLDLLDPKQGPFAPRDGYAIITPSKLDDSVIISR